MVAEMREKKHSGKFNSIRFISALLLMCTSLIVILMIAFGSYQAYYLSLLRIIGNNRSDVLSQIGNRIEIFKADSYTISNLYYNDSQFNSYADQLDRSNYPAFSSYMDDLTRKYKISFNQVNLDFNVVYLSADGIGYSSEKVAEDYDYINPEIRIWYKTLIDSRDEIVDVPNYKDSANNINSFLAARTVSDRSGSVIGYLMIKVNERQIYKIYSDAIGEKSNIYIADDHGYIISSNLDKIIGFQYFNMANLKTLFGSKKYAVVRMPDRKALFSKYEDPNYGFTVFEEMPLSYFLKPINETRNIVIALTLFVTALGVLLSWFFSGKITKPIMELRDNVQRVENGKNDVQFRPNSFNELNELGEGIEQMLARIRELIESEKKKEEQKRKMQYNLLQAQINPHFMYNTLFSINCLVDMNENQKASKMLSAFIQLLRGSLANPDKMITLGQQMDNLKQYGELQRFRYGDCFNLYIEYGDEIADCLMPSLLIQPLVENSIIHGMGNENAHIFIAVSARIKREKLVIEVEDNGNGMSEKQVEDIFGKQSEEEANTHIGIKNIYDRIKLIYGDHYGLRIESQIGSGTKVLINLPIVYKKRPTNDDNTGN